VHFCAGSPSSPIAANQGLYGILAGVVHKIYTHFQLTKRSDERINCIHEGWPTEMLWVGADTSLFKTRCPDSPFLKRFLTTSSQLVFLPVDVDLNCEAWTPSDREGSVLLSFKSSTSGVVTAWGIFKLTALSNASLCSCSTVCILSNFCTFGGVVMVPESISFIICGKSIPLTVSKLFNK